MRIEGQAPIPFPEGEKAKVPEGISSLALNYSILTTLSSIGGSLLSTQRADQAIKTSSPMQIMAVSPVGSSTPTTTEYSLEAISLMTQQVFAVRAGDTIRRGILKLQLAAIFSKCDKEIQTAITNIDTADWNKMQPQFQDWIMRHKGELSTALSDPSNTNAAKDMVSLVWIYSFLEGKTKDVNSFWSFSSGGGGDFMNLIIPRFMAAHYYTQNAGNPTQFKADLAFFNKSLQNQLGSAGDYYKTTAAMTNDLVAQFTANPAWPSDWVPPNIYLQQSLSIFVDYLNQ